MTKRSPQTKLAKEIEDAIASVPKQHRDAIRRAYLNAAMRDVDSWIIPNSSEEFDPKTFLANAAASSKAFHAAVRESVQKIASK